MGKIDAPEQKAPEQSQPEQKQELPRKDDGKFVTQDEKDVRDLGLGDDELELLPLKHYFDIESTNFSDDNQLRGILGWAKEKGISSREDLFSELRKVEIKLGQQNIGEKRTSRLYRYLLLDRQLSKTLKEMESYERKK